MAARLVVTDLDGTFLNDGKEIPKQNLAVVRNLKERGILFSLCSGRPVAMMQAYAKQADVALPVIGCNGAFVYDEFNKKIIAMQSFDPGTAQSIAEFSWTHEFDFLAYSTEEVFYSPNSERINVFRAYNEYAGKFGCEPSRLTELRDYARLCNERIMKILLTELHGSDLRIAADFLRGVNSIECASSMSNVIDIMPKGATKGAGVEMLAAYLGVALKDVCVFGDAINDISMMQKAGASVCMKNGVDEAKERATYVTTRTNNEAGFAEGVEKYVLQ